MNTVVFDRIADEMTQIFTIARENIDPRANLFELGLDSLMLMKLGQRLEAIYHVTVDMGYFFTSLTTLEKIVQFIEEQKIQPPVTLIPVEAAPSGAACDALLPAGQVPVTGGSSPASLPLFVQQIHSMQELFRQQLEVVSGKRMTPSPVSLPLVPPQAGVPAPQGPEALQTRSMRHNVRGLKLEEDELTEGQERFVRALLKRHVDRTARSREMMSSYREVLSDWKSTLSYRKSLKDAAYPIISAGSGGSCFRDVDGNEYIDIALGMGVHFFGHRHPKFTAALQRQIAEGYELGPQCDLTGLAAQGIARLTGCERVTFSNTGSEAVMMALRLARAHTGRQKVVMFSGAYHGIYDGVVAMRDGDGVTVPLSPGTPDGMVKDLIILDYGTEESLTRIAELAGSGDLAAVLVEPVQSRRPSLQPQTYLRRLRVLTEERDVALIFDEMVNGFRISAGGAQAHFGIRADMAIYGKVVGGGMPIGVIGGKAAYLDHVDGGPWQYGDASAPETEMIVFGGTFCRHPLALASVCAAVELMEEEPDLHATTNRITEELCDHLNEWFQREAVPLRLSYFGSQFKFDSFGRYSPLLQPLELDLFYLLLLEEGVYTWERRTCCLSIAHTAEVVQKIIAAVKSSLTTLRAGGFEFTGGGPEIFRSLTSVERRLLAEIERKRDQGAYHMPAAWIVSGKLSASRLEIALGEVIRRHDILRTSYRIVGGEYRARTEEEALFSLEQLDGGSRTPKEILQSFLRPFDLRQAPLLRAGLVRLADGTQLLMIDSLHLVMDGISLASFARDLEKAFESEVLPPPPATYADYAKIMESYLSSEACRRQQEVWKEVLSFAEPSALPLDRSHNSSEGRSVADHLRVDLDAALTQELRTFAKTGGVTLFMTLAGAYGLLLRTLTGSKDLCIGTVASGRPTDRFETTVGMFVNTLVLRLSFHGEEEGRTYLQRVREVCLGAYANQDLPFELLAEAGYGDLVSTMLTYENADEREFRLGESTLRPLQAEIPGSMFPCSLDVIEKQGVLHLDFEYDTALLDRSTVERWAGLFRQILLGLLLDPSAPLKHLTKVDEAEKARIHAFSAGEVRPLPRETLAEIFRARAHSTPDLQAVVAPDGGWTYRELDAVSDHIAAALSKRVTGEKRGVALSAERSRWFPAAVLGILKAGGWYLPLLPDTPPARAEAVLKDADVAELLVSEGLLAPCSSWGRKARTIEACALEAGNPPVVNAAPEDLAYVLYTSGSTGQPKGVMIEQRSVVNLVRWLQEEIYAPLSSPVREGMLTQFIFDVSVQHLFGALLNGHSLHILPEHAAADGHSLRRILAEHPLDLLDMTPSQFMLLTGQGRQVDFGSVRHLNFGAEALTREHLTALYARPENRRLSVRNMYGPTETCVQSASLLVTPELLEDDRPVTLGRPIFNTQIHILDEDSLPVGTGTYGEIWIGGAGLARGYLGQEALTREVFRETSFGRLYRSGDRGRWRADGTLEFSGRRDDQVKIMGHRIELGEIEAVARQHPDVSTAAVVTSGEGGSTRLILYVAPSQDPLSLRSFLEDRLPVYMVPRVIHPLGTLPLTAGGKIDKRRLPRVAAELVAVRQVYIPPAAGPEQLVAGIFSRVLGSEQVGRLESFFDLGGDSIKALQIVARLVEAGYAAGVADVFQARTVAALAATLKKKAGPRRGAYAGLAALSPMQRWFLEEHDSGRHHYNHALLFLLPVLPVESVRRAVLLLWEHHDALRALFTFTPSGWQQTILPAVSSDAVFAVIDLGDQAEPLSSLEEDAARRQASFSLSKGPLFQVVLYRWPQGQRLFFLAHHLVVDGVTWRILLSDFEVAVAALQSGREPILAPRSLPFAEWSAGVAKQVAAGSLRTTPHFWASQLEAAVPLFPGAPGVRGMAERAVHAVRDISEHELSTLPSSAYGGSAAEILLAAFLEALREKTNGRTISLLLEGHGRELPPERVDLSRTAGWFTSLFPVSFPLPSSSGERAYLIEVKEISRASSRNGFDYSALRYSAGGDADLKTRREPEITFNYLGRFDEGGSLLQPAGDSAGRDTSPALSMSTAFELDVFFAGGELRLEASFLPARVTSDVVHAVLLSTVSLTREYLDLCRQQPERTVSASDLSTLPFTQAGYLHFLKEEGFSAEAVDDLYPLTSAQEGMLFYAQREPESGAYFEQLWFDLQGNLSLSEFQGAWKSIVHRHPALRTVFRSDRDGRPLQVVLRESSPEMVVKEWEEGSALTEAEWVELQLREDRARPFDLERGPLLRCTLLRLGGDRWKFVQSYSHLIADGWCIGLLLSEFITLYADSGSLSNLAGPVPFSRFVVAREEAEGEEAAAFWEEHMAGAARTGIATTRRGSVRRMESFDTELSAELVTRLEQAVREAGITLGALFQAVWSLLLARHNRTMEVTFGLVVSGRSIEVSGIEEMVGLCIETLPARARLTGAETLTDLARHLQESQWAMEQHPSGRLAALGVGAVVDHILVFENYPMDATLIDRFATAGLKVSSPGGYEQVEYNLSVEVNPGRRFGVTFHYNAAVYEAALFPELARQLTDLFAQFARGVDRPLGDYRLAPAEVSSPPGTEKFVAVTETVMRLAAEDPGAEAFVWQGRSFPRSELVRRTQRLASSLMRSGVKRGDVVLVPMERSEDVLPVILGIWLAGAVYLPLDPASGEERLAGILSEHPAAHLLALRGDEPLFAGRPRVLSAAVLLREAAEDSPRFPVLTEDDIAYILYTSGSTGRPKGVVVAHGSLTNLASWIRGEIYQTISGRVRETWIPPLHFDASLHSLLGTVTGGHSLLIPEEETRNDPESLLALMRLEKSQVANTTPTYFSVLLDLLGGEPWPGEVLILGAESIPPHLIERFFAVSANRKVVVYNLYGPTEATVEVAWHRMTAADWSRALPIPIGRPIGGAALELRDEGGQPLAVGLPGEIWICGLPVACGYHQRPEETARAFPLSPEGFRSYRTGDLGRRLPEGSLVFLGRTDRQLKVRGFRIEPGEIESRLMECEGVTGAAVVALEVAGDREKILAAFLVGAKELSLEALRGRLSATLPGYMIPEHLQQLAQLPLTANHKLDENALRQLVEYRPSPLAHVDTCVFLPRNGTESLLAELWEETLQSAPASADASFFDAGGNSLAAMRLAGRIRSRFGREFKIRSLYETPRFEMIAALLAGEGEEGPSSTPSAEIASASGGEITEEEKRLLGIL